MDRAGSSGGSSTAPNLLITCDALQNLGLKPGEPPLSALEESFVVRNVARPLKGFKARAMICFAHERYRCSRFVDPSIACRWGFELIVLRQGRAVTPPMTSSTHRPTKGQSRSGTTTSGCSSSTGTRL